MAASMNGYREYPGIDFQAAFFAAMAAIGLTVALAAIVLPGLFASEFERGRIAGRHQALQEVASRPHDCLAWWFNGDPRRADSNLKAACAARRKEL